MGGGGFLDFQEQVLTFRGTRVVGKTRDGVFDVQCFSGPRRNAFSIMPRVIRGGHLTHKAVRRYIGASIRVEVPDSWPVEADGELLGTGTIDVECLPHAIDFKI